MVKELGNNKSLIISILIHLFIFIIFSLIFQKNPFELVNTPISVTIQSESDSLATGIEERLTESIKKSSPSLKNRVTEPLEKTPADKINPPSESFKTVAKADEIIKENLKKNNEIIEKELKKEEEKNIPIKSPNPQIKEKDIRKFYEEFIEKKEKDNIKEKEIKINEEDKKNKAEITENIDNKNKENINESKTKNVEEDLKNLADNIDKALDEDLNKVDNELGKIGKSDPLSDGLWSSKPRKTIFFPDIASKIPDKYRKKGIGYSITAKIVFDKNGLAIKADIITSSGDIELDNIFVKELRKIRVEPISENRNDEITKEFIISVK